MPEKNDSAATVYGPITGSVALKKPQNNPQTHVHEFLGSTQCAQENDERHKHRFIGVTSEVIPVKLPNGHFRHIHGILINTDLFEGHQHEIVIETGPAIPLDDEKHVHLIKGITKLNDEHSHSIFFATTIETYLIDSRP
ncbi:YmaF family protein [Pelotomaculum isophthalicicum JI]|uniref:YmaF family protein n=1 Tax=Pelotomaculum isophthalicicum JI TaxID=947010 RepID=A0A9X4H2J9_9FIRM|nr:YmaF family protein [Pelotomaculum isophthalicicum]MDF9408925.1 YmaF family protein [Pelotomaculum isophthalicicum JI]